MGVPPQMYNELHDPSAFHACPHCGRILFVQPVEEEPDAGDGELEKASGAEPA